MGRGWRRQAGTLGAPQAIGFHSPVSPSWLALNNRGNCSPSPGSWRLGYPWSLPPAPSAGSQSHMQAHLQGGRAANWAASCWHLGGRAGTESSWTTGSLSAMIQGSRSVGGSGLGQVVWSRLLEFFHTGDTHPLSLPPSLPLPPPSSSPPAPGPLLCLSLLIWGKPEGSRRPRHKRDHPQSAKRRTACRKEPLEPRQRLEGLWQRQGRGAPADMPHQPLSKGRA